MKKLLVKRWCGRSLGVPICKMGALNPMVTGAVERTLALLEVHSEVCGVCFPDTWLEDRAPPSTLFRLACGAALPGVPDAHMSQHTRRPTGPQRKIWQQGYLPNQTPALNRAHYFSPAAQWGISMQISCMSYSSVQTRAPETGPKDTLILYCSKAVLGQLDSASNCSGPHRKYDAQ